MASVGFADCAVLSKFSRRLDRQAFVCYNVLIEPAQLVQRRGARGNYHQRQQQQAHLRPDHGAAESSDHGRHSACRRIAAVYAKSGEVPACQRDYGAAGV